MSYSRKSPTPSPSDNTSPGAPPPRGRATPWLSALAIVTLAASGCGSDADTAADTTDVEATQTGADTETGTTDVEATQTGADTETGTTDVEATQSSADTGTGTVTASSYPVVATGQSTCYDDDGEEMSCAVEGKDFYGQDASYLAGSAMSFEDNGDGTVTDPNTGLTWQQVPSPDGFTWQEAVDYADEFELAGYGDWRLPSAKELFTISDFGLSWPYLDTDYFTLASGEVTKDEQYWTSNFYVGTTTEGGSEAAFGVNHVTGHIKAYPAAARGPAGGNYVRVVRGDEYGINDLVDNGDGTITDSATGLMWAQDDDGVELDWQGALAYAEGSELAGFTDWRLPNVKELQGIVDYSRSPSATDASAVGPATDELFAATEITNEAGDSDYGYYWSSTSAQFTVAQPYYYAWYVAFGRAVDGSGEDSHGAGAVRFDTKTEDGPDGEGGERYYNFIRLVRDAG